MSALSQESLEGRLIAHRQLLSIMVGVVSDLPGGDRLAAFLEERSVFQDNEEDPGVLPTAAHAIQLAQAEEIRLIAERSGGSAAGV